MAGRNHPVSGRLRSGTGTIAERNDRIIRDRMPEYLSGNVAPKLEPVREPRQFPEREPRRDSQVPAPGTRQSRQAVKKQEKALRMDVPYIIALTIASICTLFLCVNYLHLQSSITGRMYHIEQMEAKLEKIRSQNDAMQMAIDASIDLNEIYQIATKKLGMVRAGENQVLKFNKTESEYVRQNDDIPEY